MEVSKFEVHQQKQPNQSINSGRDGDATEQTTSTGPSLAAGSSPCQLIDLEVGTPANCCCRNDSVPECTKL